MTQYNETRDPYAVASALRELADRFERIETELPAAVWVSTDVQVVMHEQAAPEDARRLTVDILTAVLDGEIEDDERVTSYRSDALVDGLLDVGVYTGVTR